MNKLSAAPASMKAVSEVWTVLPEPVKAERVGEVLSVLLVDKNLT